MINIRQMISLEEAVQVVLGEVRVQQVQAVGLLACRGRVLAQRVVAGTPLPPFDRSAMDGYAVKATDVAQVSTDNPVYLTVVGEVAAGQTASVKVSRGTTIRIMTGAPLPPGADAVVRKEDALEDGERVAIRVAAGRGENICLAGEDVAQEEEVLQPGVILTTAEISLLAALGYGKVQVFQRPRVAILSTGDELLEVGTQPVPGKIYNSNLYALAAAVEESGGLPYLLGIVPDRLEEIVARLAYGIKKTRLVLTTGGVSVGDYDLVKEALKALGAEILFWRVAMKPGMPVVCARKGPTLILGLSGNPAAALINFEHLGRPAIWKMGGRQQIERPQVRAVVDDYLGRTGGRRQFLRARAYLHGGQWHVRLNGIQGSGVLSSMLQCNALIDLTAYCGPLVPGTRVKVILLMGEAVEEIKEESSIDEIMVAGAF